MPHLSLHSHTALILLRMLSSLNANSSRISDIQHLPEALRLSVLLPDAIIPASLSQAGNGHPSLLDYPASHTSVTLKSPHSSRLSAAVTP